MSECEVCGRRESRRTIVNGHVSDACGYGCVGPSRPAPTVASVVECVEFIARHAGDDEEAHALEDRLRDAVLRAIASGVPSAADLAAAALKTGQIDFQRWYA